MISGSAVRIPAPPETEPQIAPDRSLVPCMASSHNRCMNVSVNVTHYVRALYKAAI